MSTPEELQAAMAAVDWSNTTDVKCSKCGHDVFVPVFLVKKISAIMSPNGQEIIAPMQVFGCNSCGHINEEFMPREA